MFQSSTDTFLQLVYSSATHFCPACAATQAPLHLHTELGQGLPTVSCVVKPNNLSSIGRVNTTAKSVQNKSLEEKKQTKKAAGSKG